MDSPRGSADWPLPRGAAPPPVPLAAPPGGVRRASPWELGGAGGGAPRGAAKAGPAWTARSDRPALESRRVRIQPSIVARSPTATSPRRTWAMRSFFIAAGVPRVRGRAEGGEARESLGGRWLGRWLGAATCLPRSGAGLRARRARTQWLEPPVVVERRPVPRLRDASDGVRPGGDGPRRLGAWRSACRR